MNDSELTVEKQSNLNSSDGSSVKEEPIVDAREEPKVDQLEELSTDQQEERYDRGMKAWASVIGGFLATASTFGYSNSFGVYQDIYTRSGTASPSRISWIGSTQIFFLMSTGIIGGGLLDKGYFRPTLLAGTVLYVVSLFMVSLAHHDKYYQIFLSQAVGMGIGSGLIYVPALAVQAHHWRSRRALAMGIVMSGSAIGGIFFPIMLNQLFKGTVGFQWGVRASAFVALGMLIPANILMSDNPKALKKDKPPLNIRAILTDAPYMATNISGFLSFWGLFFPYFYIQLFSILNGIDSNVAFHMLSIMNASSFFGRVIPNFMADRTGPLNTNLPCSLACAVLIFAMLGVKSLGSTIAFAIIYGFFSGGFISLAAPIVAGFTRHPSEGGIRFGISFFISSLGALTGTPIDGSLLGETRFIWKKPIVFSAVTLLAGFFINFGARHYFAKRQGTQLV